MEIIYGLDVSIFEGYFQRDPALALLSKEYTERMRIEHPEYFSERQRNDDLLNQQYPFKIHVFTYNHESGSFIASAKDYFGESGLVGTINESLGAIEFRKIYTGKSNLPEGVSRFSEVLFKGSIGRSQDSILCRGTYRPCIHNDVSGNLRGIWELTIPSQ